MAASTSSSDPMTITGTPGWSMANSSANISWRNAHTRIDGGPLARIAARASSAVAASLTSAPVA